MKKLITLSLALALSSAGAAAILNENAKCPECKAFAQDEQQSTINRDLLIGNGFMVVHKDGLISVLPNDNTNTTTNYNNTQTYNTNNATNQNRTSNVDTMSKTNNLDTYKNSTTTPQTTASYNNATNGVNKAQNSITANYVTPTNYNTNTQTINSPAKANTQQTTQNLNTQNSTIQNLQSQLASQKEEFNTKIEKINSILTNYNNSTISLNGEQASMLNGYIDVVQKLTHKLMRTRYTMALDIDNFFNTSTFTETDTTNPYMLEIKSILGSRIICFDCLNEALDNITNILQNYTNNQSSTLNNSVRNTTNSNNIINNTTTTNNNLPNNTLNNNSYTNTTQKTNNQYNTTSNQNSNNIM